MPLIIINTTTIHVALTNCQTERFICPWLIIIRRNRIIVLIENNCFRIWIWTLEFCQDKWCRIGLVNCHLCTNTRENLTKVSSHVIETNILSKNRFFRNQSPQDFKIVLSNRLLHTRQNGVLSHALCL